MAESGYLLVDFCDEGVWGAWKTVQAVRRVDINYGIFGEDGSLLASQPGFSLQFYPPVGELYLLVEGHKIPIRKPTSDKLLGVFNHIPELWKEDLAAKQSGREPSMGLRINHGIEEVLASILPSPENLL